MNYFLNLSIVQETNRQVPLFLMKSLKINQAYFTHFQDDIYLLIYTFLLLISIDLSITKSSFETVVNYLLRHSTFKRFTIRNSRRYATIARNGAQMGDLTNETKGDSTN